MRIPLLTALAVILFDQIVKIWIKTTMYLGQEFPVFGKWFYIHFTENNGMAFGVELGGDWGKLALSVFRIIAVGGIFYYLHHLSKNKAPLGLRICIGLIMAGALGNIIDSAVYGVLFSGSFHQIATFMPEEGGYAPFLYGRVVDMLYFPMIDWIAPDSIPLIGGERIQFFRPVFNIADSAITVGVTIIILFQKRFFPEGI